MALSGYRNSPLADEAPGHVETIPQHDGHTMGGRRLPAYIGLAEKTGGVWFENPPDTEEAFKQAGLDFEVTLEPLMATVMTDDGVSVHELTRHKATVGRYPDGRIVPFGPVGSRYTAIQNPTVADLGRDVVEEDGKLLAVGAFGDPIGARVFMAFHLGDFLIGGSDPHNLALNLITTHDGTGGLTAQTAPMRVSCTNQVSGIFGKNFAGRYTIRHTESANGRAQEVRQALGMSWKYVDRYQTESETLLGARMTEHDFLAWEHELFQVPALEDASQRQRTHIGNRDELLLGIWRGPTSEFGRGTRWSAAQSVYEYIDHVAAVRGADPEAARWERTLSGQTEATKGLAWASLVAG